MMLNSKEVLLKIPNFAFDLHLLTHGDEDLVSRMIINDKIWEAYETQLMIEHVHAGDCVIDIGANIGYYSLIASKLVTEQGKVLSFEPEEDNFNLLKHNIETNQLTNVEIFHAGLGSKEEQISFFKCHSNRGDHRAFNDDGTRELSFVNIKVGDTILKNKKVDFIKIDTQGFELAILQGLKNTLRTNQQHLKMIVEFWPFALDKNGASAIALINELASYDFNVHIIDHIHHHLLSTSFDALKKLADNELAPSTQGFINLWLTPKSIINDSLINNI